MGNRKGQKGQQSQPTSRKQKQNASFEKQQMNNKQHKSMEDDFTNSTSSFGITSRDILVVVIAALFLAVLSLAASMATGVSVAFTNSHDQSSLSLNNLQPESDVVIPAQRVTTLDHDILSHNSLADGAELDVDRQTQLNGGNERNRYGDSKDNLNVVDGNDSHYYYDAASQVHITLSENKVQPTLCSDGVTLGFSDWHTLKAAIDEANSFTAAGFIAGAASSAGTPADDSFYYEEEVLFTICPGAAIKSRRDSLYINSENIILECEHCVIDVHGTHLSFGPQAKNVVVRGITFRGASTSSLTFHSDGADALFEDCYWTGNVGNGKVGAVADINSTSSVAFYRCEIADTKFAPRQSRGGGVATSLTIRGDGRA
eukprot:CAMPEP_0195303320 /NCGR_PEP_ID=MMETSP0707-20130614/32587_1 /TAXON_ID=33640 /ORGANISM="Asterionellopsis glacialis, Strain CCMP134" /LENGTH=371 /DNA_ID=CAMNT_0040366827 /DNA_START=42 /DNA_END=1157 /DNA_ORIENTATION=+